MATARLSALMCVGHKVHKHGRLLKRPLPLARYGGKLRKVQLPQVERVEGVRLAKRDELEADSSNVLAALHPCPGLKSPQLQVAEATCDHFCGRR